jgi:magnesium chelatase subunit I
MANALPTTLGALRTSEFTPARVGRLVKDELRENLIAKLRASAGTDDPLFPGIVGYEDTVVPQLVNAVLSRHNFILLGLRGQAKSRILRALTTLLDPQSPYVAGSEVRDNPYAPISKFSRDLIAKLGDDTPIAWMTPNDRYVEKLATPDVTVADLVGDIDPIKAARSNQDLGSELTMHYGLLPRANRGIFAINELPDLAGKIQVALFNIMQEGDVQIKGYPVRYRLQRQPRGLHRPRQDRHSAQGPHRLGDTHALPGEHRGRHPHHRAGGLDRASSPTRQVRQGQHRDSALCPPDRRADRL